MKRKYYIFLVVWLVLLTGQYYFSKNVVRFFPEFVLPSFAKGDFRMDTLQLEAVEIKLLFSDSAEKTYSYQTFLYGLSEYMRNSSYRTIFFKSKENLDSPRVRDWYFKRAEFLDPGKICQEISVNKVKMKLVVNQFKVDQVIEGQENYFTIYRQPDEN